MMPPTITMSPTINAFGSPRAPLTNCARPIVPAAPPLLSNCTDCTTLAACIAAANARPVMSQPPPGLAGIIILRFAGARAAAQNGQWPAAIAAAARVNSRRSMASPRLFFVRAIRRVSIQNGLRRRRPFRLAA